jgi:SAM-dependent methyltransferase
MTTSEEHYRNLLASYYSWMFGVSFDVKIAEQRAFLDPLLTDTSRGLAVDLGSGPGFQSFSLAQLGFGPIHAIDTSAELLAELESHRRHDPAFCIHTHHTDILNLADLVAPASAAVVVCMGDTLTHLPSFQAVRDLFSDVAAVLVPDGVFITTWRDLTNERAGTERFIPVRSSENIIMTCFLEYISSTTVCVHDLVYTRDSDCNSWSFAKSSYPKLRLAPAQIIAELTATGLISEFPGTAGHLSLIVARKSASRV